MLFNVYTAIRCILNLPLTYRDLQGDGDWWYAKCYNCNRQTEVHSFGGQDASPNIIDGVMDMRDLW